MSSNRFTWYAIGVLALVNVFNFMDRLAFAVLAPLIKSDLQLSDAQLGLLIGFAFALFYGVCGVPIARWADRGVRRDIVAVALTTWSAMTALSGAAQNFWQLFAARVGMGAGEAGCVPTSQSMICDLVPLRRRPGIFAVHQCGAYGGMMLGMALAGWLGEEIGWRLTFVALGLPGIALGVLVRLTLHEPARESMDPKEESNAVASLTRTVRVLWGCRTYRLLLCFVVANGFVQYGLNQWWPSLYARAYGLSLSSLGVQLGLAMGVGSACGLLVGGLSANSSAQHDVRMPLMLGAAVTSLALLTALGSLFASSAKTSIIFTSLTAALWSVPMGSVTANLYSVVTSRMRATAGAFAIFCSSLFGVGLGPFCVGILSDVLSPTLGAESLRYALIAPVLMLPLMAILLYVAAKQLPLDLKMTQEGGGAELRTEGLTASSSRG